MNEIPHWMQDHEEADNRRFSEIRDSLVEIKNLLVDEDGNKKFASKEDVQPFVDAYKAVLLSRSFVTGLASVIIGITAIGAAIIWIINSVIHK